ncbi:extracellular solute-binding protein [Limnobacter humi]|uniref:Extracellular solute-binding protein n=1 Tax=Limnobacter humi TaxID=1778671 RepID=A0ABT1WG65_9BURK|nr:extracellular solute-binding protein [Limnobacter humi]MCQ8896505.1 extracellular solute-binding protein [Limnobacter humi]
MNLSLKRLMALSALGLLSATAHAEEKVLNLYSARHYATDEALYSDFTKQTGITIKRLDLGDEALLERLRNEGPRSPADVVLLVDAARLSTAQDQGLFQPVKSKVLADRIPAQYTGKDGLWYAFSARSRAIVYNKASIDPNSVQTYDDLAKPALKGKVCTRSGAHPYMLSLVSSLVANQGEKAATDWANGMVANMARSPKGGDTDQIRAVASGECGVALTNTYYWVRLLNSDKPEDKDVVSKVGFIWPNQKTTGAHMNVSGGAVAANAPNKANAVKFLEYLASDTAQKYFANGNNEWPVAKGVKLDNPGLESLGPFKADVTPAKTLAANTAVSQRIMDKAGYK